MRILQVNTYHYRRGGDAVHALALGEALRADGHDVRFFGMRHPSNLPSPDSEYWMPYIDFAEMNRHKSLASAARVLGRTLYSREAARRIGRMVDEWRPDVAHLHSIHGHLSLSVLAELDRRGVPIVWTVHDQKLLCPNTHLVLRGVPCERCKGNRFIQCTVNRCKKDSLGASVVATLEAEVDRFIGPAKRVDRFISPSRYLLGKFAEFGWDTAKFVHIPNFAPSPTAAVRRAPAPGRFAYIGRVETPKGIGALIEAIGATEGATLQVAGEGPLEGRYRALAARVAPGRVTFRGLLDQVSLDEIRDSSLALVVPSEWNENGPLTVIEALNRGCPVVASERGGLPEMVQHDVNGLLFPSGDVERLAESLRRMMSEPGLAARLGEQAARESSERSVDVYLSRLLEVYRSVIEERATKGGSH